MKKIILICFLCFSILGYSQEDILKDLKFKEYEKEVVAFMTSKDYLNYDKLKREYFDLLKKDSDFNSEINKKSYNKLKEAYEVISAKENEITKMRADLIEKYTQDEFYKANQLINKQIFEINLPYYKSIYE